MYSELSLSEADYHIKYPAVLLTDIWRAVLKCRLRQTKLEQSDT